MQKITVKIDGMACGMCESHVNDAVRKAFLVKKVTSSHKKGETVIIMENGFDEAALRAALAPTGYRVLSVQTEPYEKKDCSADEQNGKTGGKDERSIQDLKNRL